MTPSWRLAQQLAKQKKATALLTQQQGLASAALGGPKKSLPPVEQIEATKALYQQGTKVRVFLWPAGYVPYGPPSTDSTKAPPFVPTTITKTATKLVQTQLMTALTGSPESALSIANARGKELAESASPGHLALQVITPDGKEQYLSIGGDTGEGSLKSSVLKPLPIYLSHSLEEDLRGFGKRKHEVPIEITFLDPKILEKFISDFRAKASTEDSDEKYALFGGTGGTAPGSSCCSIVAKAATAADFMGILNLTSTLPLTPEGVFQVLKQCQEKYAEEQKQQAVTLKKPDL